MSTHGSRRLALAAGAASLGGLFAACGGSAGPYATSSTPSVSSSSSTTTETPTVAQLQTAAAAVYPACLSPVCANGAKFTTCDSGLSGQQGVMGEALTTCPITTRLRQQLETVTAGVASAPDPLGGGRDAQFTSESFTAVPGAQGGTVHAMLTLYGGGASAAIDLVFVTGGSKPLLEDVYCTGKDPGTTDAYAAGWLTRATCG